ncbi:MAG: hypothetical protein KFF68_12920 [Desulfosarcina sp.]|nr:hypothetical protein [Desulfosarcina sp.]
MKDILRIKLEEDTVRFTPDGKIAVIDAIGALSKTKCPDCLWEDLKRSHPQIGDWCSDYSFAEEETGPVAGNRSWMRIQDLLLDHLIDKAP